MPKTKGKYLEPKWENRYRKMLMEGPSLEKVIEIIFPPREQYTPRENKNDQVNETPNIYLKVAHW